MTKSLAFYKDKLGLKLLYSTIGRGETTSQGVGVKGADMKIAVLEAGPDVVELIQYVAPKGKPYDRLPCDIGNMHLAFRVSDVHDAYKELKKKGIRFNTLPNKITEGPMKGWIWVYFNDPDGSQLELVEHRKTRALKE